MAIPSNLDAHVVRHMPEHFATVKEAFDYNILWFQYGINVKIMVRIHAYR